MADRDWKWRCTLSPRAGILALAAAALAAVPSGATAASDVEPSAGAAASRWTLPPPNLGLRSAVLGTASRMEQVLTVQGTIQPRPTSGRAAAATAAAYWREPVADRPNVFGSVALAVSATPLDAQWQRATAVVPATGWTDQLPALGKGADEAVVGAVNRWVNARVTFTDDLRQHGRPDQWSSAAETLRRGRGDCEDYALAKMQLLTALGFESGRLFLVVVHDTFRRDDHAVLVVRLDDRFVVLDNLHDALVESGALANYRPIISYSSSGRWIHGFPVIPPPRTVELAADTRAVAP